jgi:Flp pilus assembly protein TadB
MFVIAPDYISQLFTNDFGHVLLTCGAVMFLIGIVVMVKMVSFEI